MKKIICISLLAACIALASCARHPLVTATVLEAPSSTEVETASMGETVYNHYTCPCSEVYIANKSIAIDGLPSIMAGSLWVAKHRNAETGEKYLISESYHNQLAVILKNETIAPSRAIAQFGGMKKYRIWPLQSNSDSKAITFKEYLPSQNWWRLQYIGLDKDDKNILRFTIETRIQSEIVGQIEYTHNLKNGDEFVVKGVRFKVLQARNDSTLTYQVLQP
ncbi:hypothetical protein HG264_10050 [Pseudomonas sp. gcc21]|uniref:hypothetical protein n=1 Tax=Pseudomonas sp. gcc21 TaxID=2726989 RepID=UPI001451AD17|nr:hypothetical protein [Pseudomonas sp. gcc21]QJD59222.1 hypothetical protein HG264_10050 [Pseudomonas sp. gcc21]